MPKRVLIIDDEPDVVASLKDMLTYRHFDCETAFSALVGFQKLIEFQPNLILLDLEMKEMSGFGFLRELRKNTQYKNIPILILSGFSDEDIVLEGLRLGANGYVKKTCGIGILLRTIRNYL